VTRLFLRLNPSPTRATRHPTRPFTRVKFNVANIVYINEIGTMKHMFKPTVYRLVKVLGFKCPLPPAFPLRVRPWPLATPNYASMWTSPTGEHPFPYSVPCAAVLSCCPCDAALFPSCPIRFTLPIANCTEHLRRVRIPFARTFCNLICLQMRRMVLFLHPPAHFLPMYHHHAFPNSSSHPHSYHTFIS
jgi:hypothetical protein